MTSFALPIPSATGSLDTYIQTVNRFPILTQEDETRLARRYRDHEDLEAARALIVSHLRVVVAVGRGFFCFGLPPADLIQEGKIRLMKGGKRFDPGRGGRVGWFGVDLGC